jgi:hypothetical protein
MGLARAVQEHFRKRLGRRGTLLTLFGTAYGLYGAGQFLSGPVTRFGNLGSLMTVLLNSYAIGWIWVLGGITGVVFGLKPRRESDGTGFIAVFVPLMVWTVLYSVSWVTGALTGDAYGNSRSWVPSIVWMVQAAVVLVVAGWPDPEVNADGVTRE